MSGERVANGLRSVHVDAKPGGPGHELLRELEGLGRQEPIAAVLARRRRTSPTRVSVGRISTVPLSHRPGSGRRPDPLCGDRRADDRGDPELTDSTAGCEGRPAGSVTSAAILNSTTTPGCHLADEDVAVAHLVELVDGHHDSATPSIVRVSRRCP